MNTLSASNLARSAAAVGACAVLVGTVTTTTGVATAAVSAATKPVGAVTVQDSHSDMHGHGADIFSVRLVNRDQVKVVVQHRNLVRSYKAGSSGTVYFDTKRSTTGPDYALVAGLHGGADYSLLHTDGWRIRYAKPADGSYRLRLRYDTDRTVITVGRATLGRPGDVRVAVHTAGEQSDGSIVHDWLKGRHRFTPWVARG